MLVVRTQIHNRQMRDEAIEGKVEEGRGVSVQSEAEHTDTQGKEEEGKERRRGSRKEKRSGKEVLYAASSFRDFARFSLDDPSASSILSNRSSPNAPRTDNRGRITAHVDAEASGLLSLPAPVPVTGRAASHTTRPTVPASEQFHRRGALAPAHSTPDAPTCSPTSQMHTLHWMLSA